MRILFILLCLVVLPVTAQASPWPRAAGEWFVGSTFGLENSFAGWRHFSEIYGEFGASGQLTMATQLRLSPGARRADLMARWHPRAGTEAPPLGLGAGLRLQPGGSERVHLLLAAHLGHGFDTGFGNVWARMDLQLQTRPAQPFSPVELSLAGQLGVRNPGGFIGMLSVTGKRRNGASVLELAPVIGREIGRRHTLVLGLTASPAAPRARSASLSLWSRF